MAGQSTAYMPRFDYATFAGESVEQIVDHVVLVVPGLLPVQPLLSSLGFVDAGTRAGSIVDCGSCCVHAFMR